MRPPMRLREAQPSDIHRILALERLCYPRFGAYGQRDYRHALSRDHAVNLILDHDPPWPQGCDAAAGFVGAFLRRLRRVGHVYTVNVHPDHRREGVATRLLTELEARLRRHGMARVILEVWVENEPAIRLYESLGYQRTGVEPDYYKSYPHGDAYTYAKDLR